MADTSAFLTHGLIHLEQGWPGAGESFADFVGVLREQLRDDDRVDFLVPVMQPPKGSVGRGRPSLVATLDDRAIVGWAEGMFLNKWRSAALPYDSIREVKGLEWNLGGIDRIGLVVRTPQDEWRFMFMSEDRRVDFERWRTRLWNRLDRTWIPVWQGDDVTRWVKPDADGTYATEREAGTGRRYDTTEAMKQLEAHERVRAATCGALRYQDPVQVSMESGTLFLTSARLIFISPTEDRPLTDVASIDRSARDLGGKQAEIISISFKDGSNWELASTTRTSAESEHFCSAVREVLPDTPPSSA